jgi:CMP-N-acetylneuraminic acid synthetase
VSHFLAYGLIPARGGSEGLAGKNLRLLRGQPLICYIIQAALQSEKLAQVYVSTDSGNIATVAEAAGAQIIRHDPSLSTNDAPTYGVVRNALDTVDTARELTAIVTMRATSPLCLPSDIDAAVQLLEVAPAAGAVISVCRSPIHPHRILKIDDSGLISHFGPTSETDYPLQRQSFSPVYVRNGAIYATRTTVIRNGGLWGKVTLPYLVPPERSVNINNELDFVLAEALLTKVSTV